MTGIGSLPHRDADDAAAFAFRHMPALPAAPQLPRRSALEGMLAQAVRGIEGVGVAADGSLVVETDELSVSCAAPVIDGSSHGGLLAFLAAANGRDDPVKFQLTGPVTLGLALVDAGAPPETAFMLAGESTRSMATALLRLVRRRLPRALAVVFLDEPGLVALGRGPAPVSREAATDLLSSTLAALDAEAVTGVHCCGPADWRIAVDAGADILSLPVDPAQAIDPSVAAGHLDRGGWLAWGAVPTTGPVGGDVDRHWRRLEAAWSGVVAGGADPGRLRAASLVTPACGLAGHGLSQAAGALGLARQLGERVAVAAAAA